MFHIDRSEIQSQLEAKGVDPNHIKALHVKLQSGELDHTSFVIPAEQLASPTTDDAHAYQTSSTDLGVEALQADELLLFWLNGGAATRYGAQAYAHLPKGLTPVVDGVSYLELKVKNLLLVTKQLQLPVHPQVVIMNSFVTDTQTRQHFAELFKRYPDLDPNRFHFIIQQARIPRFTRATEVNEIDVFVDNAGQLSWAPCGHGDFVYLLQEYFHTHPISKVKYMFFANIDNVAATLDPALLGMHIQSKRGRTVEVVNKLDTDQGGLPCKVNGEMMIVEQMKFPSNFAYQTLPWLNTNTFWFTLSDLLTYDSELPWIIAEKTIPEGDVIQLERFACDVNVSSQYVVVDRTQRFWPVKRYSDLLEYRQQPIFQRLLKEQFSVTV
jgi:UTP--glucose-1-phosphate uridylyltransferase